MLRIIAFGTMLVCSLMLASGASAEDRAQDRDKDRTFSQDRDRLGTRDQDMDKEKDMLRDQDRDRLPAPDSSGMYQKPSTGAGAGRGQR